MTKDQFLEQYKDYVSVHPEDAEALANGIYVEGDKVVPVQYPDNGLWTVALRSSVAFFNRVG